MAHAQPNAMNDPLFHAVGGALDAMAKDPNATNKALDSLGTIVMNASENYTAAPNREKGHVIGETMFALVNPEGSAEAGEAALKVANKVATRVDAVVMDGIKKSLQVTEDLAKTSPGMAQQSKQMLLEYTQKLGLSAQEMELAGIPKGYFDGMQPLPSAAKSDNFFVMSKAEEGDNLPRKSAEGGGGEIQYKIGGHSVLILAKYVSPITGELLTKVSRQMLFDRATMVHAFPQWERC